MKFSSLIITLLFSSIAAAFPLPTPDMTEALYPENFGATYDFEGIVGLSNCSGSIVQLENSRETDAAMILTNGHCLENGFTQPGQFIISKPSSRTFRVLNSAATTIGQVNANLIIYSTMTATDMTLYRLKETYKEIKDRFNVRPLTLSSQHPEVGTGMEVISGYWKKGYSCTVEKFVDQLKEDKWTMVDSIRYSRPGCETIGGTSGSPIIQAGTRIVIGVNNTGNEDGQRCTMNNPCELDSAGNISATKGYSYGQQTYWVYSCLNKENQFDFNQAGCKLPH